MRTLLMIAALSYPTLATAAECGFQVYETFAVPDDMELMKVMVDAFEPKKAPDGYHLVVGEVKRTRNGVSKLALQRPVWRPSHGPCDYTMQTSSGSYTLQVPAEPGMLAFRRVRRSLRVNADLPIDILVATWVRFDEPGTASPVHVVWHGALFGVRSLEPESLWEEEAVADIRLLRSLSTEVADGQTHDVQAVLSAQLATDADPSLDQLSLVDWHTHQGNNADADAIIENLNHIDKAAAKQRLGLE